ncbi:GNAT family N-acetyltransferase [Nocardioides sp. P5_C9_2]
MTTIEHLGPDDWRDFREIRMRALADAPTAFGITLAEVEDQPEDVWRDRLTQGDPILAVRDDERLVAMGAGWLPPETPDTMMVWGMWTAPEARGRGLASTLLDRLVDHARERGLAVVELHVTEGNDTARRLYEECGFLATGEWTPLREGSRLRIELLRKRVSARRP